MEIYVSTLSHFLLYNSKNRIYTKPNYHFNNLKFVEVFMKKVIFALAMALPFISSAYSRKESTPRFNPKLTIPASILPRLTENAEVDINAVVTDLTAWNALDIDHGSSIALGGGQWWVSGRCEYPQLDTFCNESFVVSVTVVGTGESLSA